MMNKNLLICVAIMLFLMESNALDLPAIPSICDKIDPLRSLEDDCHSYYSCLKIGVAPQVFKCGINAYFNDEEKRCVRGTCENSGLPIVTEAPNPNNCIVLGPTKVDENDCNAYFSCVVLGEEPKRFICQRGSYFLRERKRCVRGVCKTTPDPTAPTPDPIVPTPEPGEPEM